MLESDTQLNQQIFVGISRNRERESSPIHETLRRMHEVTMVSFDVDKFILDGGMVPLTEDDRLDIGTLQMQSPDTLPILHRMAVFESYGIPCVPITGKSGTIARLYEYKTRLTLLNLRDHGVIRWKADEDATIYPYPIDPNKKNVIGVRPDFFEPITGRIRALSMEHPGKPSETRLVFSIAEFDNGAAFIDLTDPFGHYEAKKFPPSFFQILGNPVLQDLLRRSTRSEKFKKQARVNPKHIALSENQQYMGQPLFPDHEYYDMWYPVAEAVKDFSYPSPHGSKFNLELGMEKLKNDVQLQAEWTDFFLHVLGGNATPVTDIRSLENNLRLFFALQSGATVTANYVDDKRIGPRVVIDLNPPKTQKARGAKDAILYMRKVYDEAGFKRPPAFEKGDLAGGDQPNQNDRDLICHQRGVTNCRVPYNKKDGFPTDIRAIIEKFGGQIHGELRETEETLIFFQLLLHAKLELPKDDLPEETKAKVVFD